MLLRKFGLPQATIWRIMAMLKRGRVKRSSALPRRNGMNATTAHTAMPRQVASAAPQMPKRNTPRNRNSSAALRPDISRFSSMLPRM